MENNFYWELVQRDGTKLMIPPKFVKYVQDKMAAKEPIRTSTSIVPFSEIQAFRQSSKRERDERLIEDVAQAFGDPIITKREFPDGTADEAVATKWVKKEVSQNEWERYYSGNGYRKLDSEQGVVMVAFRVPTHLVDTSKVEYCTSEEIVNLTRSS